MLIPNNLLPLCPTVFHEDNGIFFKWRFFFELQVIYLDDQFLFCTSEITQVVGKHTIIAALGFLEEGSISVW